MIPISYLFEDDNMQLIENWTVYCIEKYGEPFLESLIPFFEDGDTTIMEQYYNESGQILFEAKADLKMSASGFNRIKQAIRNSRSNVGKYKREGLFKKATDRLSKSKVGKAIVKGVKSVAYGTRAGKKVMSAYAKYRAGSGKVFKSLANTAEKAGLATAAGSGAQGSKKGVDVAEKIVKGSERLGKIGKSGSDAADRIKRKLELSKIKKVRIKRPTIVSTLRKKT